MHFYEHSPKARALPTDDGLTYKLADLPTSVETVIHRWSGDSGMDICQEKGRGRKGDWRFVISACIIDTDLHFENGR